VQVPEAVHEPGVEQLSEPSALLVGETCGTAVGARVLQVDLLVGHVQVAAEHHGLLRRALHEEGPHPVLEIHAETDPREFRLGVGAVHADEPEPGELERAHATLVVDLVGAEAVPHLQRLDLGEHGGAGVALALRVAPVLVVLRQVECRLPLLELGLLQGDDVGVDAAHDALEVLLEHGAQAVHVP